MTRLFVVAIVLGALVGCACAMLRRGRAGAGGSRTSESERAAAGRAPGPITRGIVGALMYVFGPLRVLRNHQIVRNAAALPVSPSDFNAWPEAVRSYITRTEGTLTGLGFGAGARVRMSSTAHVMTYVSLLEHERHSTLASVSVVQRDTGQSAEIVFFRSEIADGTAIISTNGRVKRRFPRRAGQVALSFPELSDPAALLAVHRFRVSEYSGGKPPRTITRSPDPVAYQCRETLETFDHFLRIGYYRRAPNEILRLTPKGALCTVWRGKFPWAQLTDWRDGRRRSQVLSRYAAAKASGTDTAAA